MPDSVKQNTTPTRILAKKVRTQVNISRVTIERTAKTLIVKLPLTAARYLHLDENSTELFATPINGVVQLSGFQPNMTIPVVNLTADDFMEQPA